MKILAVADLHLTDNAAEEYRHTFVREHLPMLYDKHAARGLLINGDLTEAKDRHSARLVNRIVGHLAELSAFAPVVILMGNHDYANEGEPFFKFASELPGVLFIDRVTPFHRLPPSFRKVFENCLFLPHTRDHENDWKGINFHDFNWTFAHQTFQDADAGYGRRLDGINVEWFDGCEVIAGDIHKPQNVQNVTYIGAPYTIDFGDDYSSRVLLVDTAKYETIPTAHLPQKRLVHCAPEEDLIDKQDDLNEGDLVRVRVDVDTMEGWKEIVDLVHRQARKLEVSIERVEPVILRKTKRHSIKPVSGNSKKSDAELVKQFGDRERLSDSVLDVGLSIVESD